MATPRQCDGAGKPNRDSVDPRYKQNVQPYYSYNCGAWREVINDPAAKMAPKAPSEMRLLTWNIDFLSGGGDIRMHAALNLLEQEIDNSSTGGPIVIMLQEMDLSDLQQIQASKWIRDRFYITDISNKNWADERYGTTTLVDKNLVIQQTFRTYYDSKFGRDALFVDIAVAPTLEPSSTMNDESSFRTLRIANTHLESLVASPPLRPAQVAAAAYHLQAPEVYAGILAGDLNAIEDFDRTLHVENELKDAYLALGGVEDAEGGYTWGYQSEEQSMRRFGPSRMDKILFCGGVRVGSLKRIGVGAKVEEGRRSELRGLTRGLEWITDHYGLMATVMIVHQQGEVVKL